MAGESRTLKLSILADVDNLKKSLNSSTEDVQNFGSKIGDFGKKLVGAFAFAEAGKAVVGFARDSITAASDLNESYSKINVLFGETDKAILAFADKAGTALGQTKQQALDAAANFAIFGKSAGLTGEKLVSFSTEFTTLASDLASFNNTSPEDAINAIGSALRGESEPLRRYGVLLNDASLKAAAMKMGIYDGSGALTSQQKILAAQTVIMEQTTAAQGDFARTSDGLANRQRILAAEIENAKGKIGEALLPIMLKMTSIFSEQVIPIVKLVAEAFRGEGGLGEVITGFVEIIKAVAMPVFLGIKDAFNSISKALKGSTDETTASLEGFTALFEFLKKYVAPFIGGVLKVAIQALGIALGAVLSVVMRIIEGFKDLIDLGKKIKDGIGNLFGGNSSSSSTTGSVLNSASNRAGSIGRGMGQTINITVNGAVDAIGTARQIAQILSREATTSGTFSNLGVSKIVSIG